MSYEFESRIRYSETGTDKKLTLVSMVDYFQDCTTFHSESCGYGIDFVAGQGNAWMILSWQIDIARYPVLGENVRIWTAPYSFKGFYGYRNFALISRDGEYLAKANSVWVFMDRQTGRPCRILPEHISGYGQDPKLDMEYLSRKIGIPTGGEKKEAFQVHRYQIDTNNHVNNGQYIRMAEEYLPEGAFVSRLRVEYRKQAYVNDTIVPVVLSQGREMLVSLCDLEEKPYAVVAFTLEDA